MKLLLVAPLLVATTMAQQQADQHHMNPAVSSQEQNEQNDIITGVPPSPECWMGAMKAMHQLERDAAASHDSSEPPLSLGSIVCTAMSHNHKKALALELARCQMQDVGRSLFINERTKNNNDSTTIIDCSRPVESTRVLHSCLSTMTDAGMHSYSLFFTHVHQSCTRLTQEQLVQASQVATEQLHTMLAHQSEMWAEREERDQELRAQHEEMLETLWSKAEEREKEIAELTKNVEATAEKMKPLLGIESLVSMATNGVTWLTSLIHFLGMMNAVWLLTLSKRHDATRRYMFRIACVEALMEFAMHWMVTQGLLADMERVRGIGILRSWTLTLECCTYVVGLFLSVFRKPRRQEDAMNETMVEMMQLIAANADKLHRKEAPPQPKQRVVEVVVPRMQQPVIHLADENVNDSSVGLVSLPPMYKEFARPNVGLDTSSTIPTRETVEQNYAAAYQEALRVLSQQASMAAFQHNAIVPAHRVCPPQDSPPQLNEAVEIIHEHSDSVNKDPKKRLLEDDEDEVEEPDKKRARK